MADKWFAAIETHEQARKAARHGASGVAIFAAMYLLGAVFALLADRSPVDGQGISAEEVQNQVLGNLVLLPLLLFFAYRVYAGKGWLVCSLTLLWFVAEAVLKLTSGVGNAGWIFFYFAVAALLINGIRGCWWLRQHASAASRPEEPVVPSVVDP